MEGRGLARTRGCCRWCANESRETPRTRARRRSGRRTLSTVTCRASSGRGGKKAREGEANGGGLSPNLEMAVPKEQRPVNELNALREGPISGWAGLDLPSFVQRLGAVWIVGFVFSCPVAAGSYEPSRDTPEFLLSAGVGATLLQTALVVRLYTSWNYVAKRLLSAAFEYEETGWYDGQTFLKPPEVLARDRLLGTYEVKPIMAKLKLVTFGTVGGLLACVLALGLFDTIQDTYASQAPTARLTQNGILYNSFITDINVLKESDDAAAAEAAAQKGRPGYCGDEYYRAMAGGSAGTCEKLKYKGGSGP
mmetsp:Transcript_14026/g.39682  ORF Transcript_14026/g.39682 Transcript_14026/m.39682 type:complete len:308 (-) Transcript_14026:1725-2648(-)